MAENVGTITVAIEAQTAELQAGLASAERAVKQSAQKMEQQTENLAQRAEKSWTEFASKMGVIQQVGAIAQQTWNALDGVLSAVTDSTANASQKLTGSLDAIEAAGIPVVSQFLAIGRGLHGWISGETKLRAEIERTTHAIQVRAKAALDAFNARKAQRDELTEMTGTMLTLLENEEMLARETTEAGKAQLTQTQEREALQEAFEKRMESLKDKATQSFLAEEEYKFKIAMGYLDQKHSREMEAAKERDAANETAHQAEIGRVQKEAKAKEEAAAREAKAIENTTQGLRDTLAQLTAKSAGDELGAQMIALEAKFRKMREGATSEQLALIAQIEAKEKEALTKRGLDTVDPTTGKVVEGVGADGGADGGAEDGGGRDATTSVSTAIGSFTVAMAKAGDPIQKKQTSLLERIATSNAKIADIQEKEKAVKEDVPTKETKIVEATKEKETKTKETEIVEATKDKEKESVVVVEKALTGMQKIAEDTQATIKDLTRQVLALGATEGQSDETKAKRAELREDIAKQFKYKEFLQREASIESDRMKMLAASEQAVPVAPTPQEVVGGAVERDEGQIEQTTLLQKIADSNEKVAEALSRRSNEAVILAT